MQYSVILSDTHVTQAFTWLEQGPDELLGDYLHHATELLSKIYHTSDMSSISAEGTSHYVVVNGLNCRKLNNTILGHWSTQWRMIEESVLSMNELRAIAEPNLTPLTHHISMRLKPWRREAYATSAEDQTFSAIAKTTAAANSKPKHQHNKSTKETAP